MLNVYIEENPTVDLFGKKFEKEEGTRLRRKKRSEERSKPNKRSPP